MSMPTFPKSGDILSREEAVNAVISSIAMEEAALSHILNAEGEKIQYVLEKEKNSENPDLKMVLAVNKSVESLVGHINDAQIILKNKLNLAASILPHYDCGTSETPHHHEPHPLKPAQPNPPPVKPPPIKPPHPKPPPVTPPCPKPPPPKPPPVTPLYPNPNPFWPPRPKPPCPPPKPPCQPEKPPCPPEKPPCPPPEKPPGLCEENPHSCVFAAPCGHNWAGESTLCLEGRKCSDGCSENYSGVKICRENRETYILLPGSTAYEVGLELELTNQNAAPVSIEATFVCNNDEVFDKTYSFGAEKQNIHICDKIEIPFRHWAGKFSIRLLSQKSILIKGGRISVSITGRR